MSGKDELPFNLLFECGCENFEYWAMLETNIKCLGWLNNERHPRIRDGKYSFGDPETIGRVNLRSNMIMAFDEFEGKIRFIQCHGCRNVFKRGTPKFKILISYLKKHWNERMWR